MGMSLFNLGKAFHDELTGKLIVVALVLLFFVLSFVIFLHLYAKWYLYRSQPDPSSATATVVVRRRRRLDFASGYYLESSAVLRRGIDPTVLKTIPILSFSPDKHENGMECAVCLSEITDSEKFRLLPKCHHGFHVDCIDMWFQSHATCPLCRNSVSEPKKPELNIDSILEIARVENNNALAATAALFPTNVLFWGNQAQVSTRTLSGGAVEEENTITGARLSLSPSPSSSSSEMITIDMHEDEEQGIVTTRFRSLRRLLSRDRKVNPCSSTSGDTQL